MNKIYTIFSPGRTGSHIILEMLAGTPFNPGGLANAYGVWLPMNKKECLQYVQDQDQNLVIHLHNLDLLADLDPANINLIISLRRDVFAQVMSLIVAQTVDEWSGKDYGNKSVDAVAVDPAKFVHILKSFVNWSNGLDLSGFKQVVTIYYEDLIEQGAEFLARELGLEYAESRVGQVYQPSPYRYKDIILNWPELYQEYLQITRTMQD